MGKIAKGVGHNLAQSKAKNNAVAGGAALLGLFALQYYIYY